MWCTKFELQKRIKELRIQSELSGAQSDLDRVKSELSELDIQLKKKIRELSQLTNKMPYNYTEPEKKRHHILRLLKQNKMEIELPKTKLDMMNLNGHLMEAIQQKNTLSQQLDQWQVDMEELLELQIRKRIKKQTSKEEVKERRPS